MSTQQDPQRVLVWDILIRIFHWTLVFTFFLAFITEDDWINLHINAGYVVALLIIFRLIWGIVGTPYARLSQLIKLSPKAVEHIKQAVSLKSPHYLGHNPAASAMIIMLILSLIMVSITGMSIIANTGAGPLAGTFFASLNPDWMEEIHEFFANLTMLLVFLHVAGVIFSSFIEGENLIVSMINGYKKYNAHAIDKHIGDRK